MVFIVLTSRIHALAHILIIEDDIVLNQQVADLLQQAGYRVDTCNDGEQGLLKAVSHKYQLVLLDVMLPSRDGFSVLNMLRKSCQIPVMMITAKGAEEERILGLRNGADDYLSKPFNPMELLLRVEAILRRANPAEDSNKVKELHVGALYLKQSTQVVTVNSIEIDFTPIQFKLLWELLLHKGEVLTKAYLYQAVLNRSIGAYDRSIDMHLSRIRKKLNMANWPGERLQTCHGKGYCLI